MSKRAKESLLAVKRPALRRHRTWIIAASLLLALILVVAGGVSWYYAGEIHSGAFAVEHDPPEFNILISQIDGEVISQDCETCHALLAIEEEQPEVLEWLAP